MELYYLSGALKLAPGDHPDPGRQFCVCIGERVFHASAATARLLEAIDAGADLGGIVARVNAGRHEALSVDAVRSVIADQLLPAGLVATTPVGTAVAKPRVRRRTYLFLSCRLFGKSLVTRLSRPLIPLLSGPVAAMVVTACLVVVAAWLADIHGVRSGAVPGLFGLSPGESALLYGSVFAAFLLHELGHAAAARKYGAEPTEIGIGLYLIFPVLFCNVTDAWRLPRGPRIVINLAGAYFQLIATALLILAQAAFGSAALGLAIVVNLVSILVTLNPFLRFDGYWVYSDYFNLPNLRETASRYLADRVRGLLGIAPDGAAAVTPSRALRWYAAGTLLMFGGFALIAGPVAVQLPAGLPQALALGVAKLQQDHSLSSVAIVMSSALGVLVYVAGCLLTLGLVARALWRGAIVLRQVWQQRAMSPG